QELAQLGKAHGIRVAAIYGGVRYENQIKDLRSGVQIIVATPGRTLDLIDRRDLDCSSVRQVVLVEGDTMLEMVYQRHFETILSNVKSLRTQVREETNSRPRAECGAVEDLIVTQNLREDKGKEVVGAERVSGGGQTIVFTNMKVEADSIVKSDLKDNFKIQALHGVREA
ncbi:hypothetical protein B484DRAFT_471693, partial [Ochromonadaceae sp. CCMP2298]